jgi:hypothetical protein
MFHEHKIHNYLNLSLFQKEANFRVLHRRVAIQDTWKNVRQNIFCNSSQSPATIPTLSAYHCFTLSSSENENNFHRSVSCDMPEMVRQA